MEDPDIPPRPLSPNKIVRQLEEVVQILRQQITILETKNTALSNQVQLLILREQHCICFNPHGSSTSQESVTTSTGVSQSQEGSSVSSSGASTQVLSQSFDDITNLERRCVEYLTSQRPETPEGLLGSDGIKRGESGSISLGSIQIMPSEDDGDCWTTAQSIGWPLSTEMGNYEIVLVSQGPSDSGMTETVVSLSPEIERKEVVMMDTIDESESKETETETETEDPLLGLDPDRRQPGQRGRLAAKLTCNCPICGKALSGKRSLRQHIPIHTGQKNHMCDICEMSFITKSNLTRHIRKHTGEKPYECQYCGRAFAHLGDVHMHHRTHTGERPFSCTLCDNNFVTAAHLRRHLKSHERKPEGWQGNDRPGTGEDQTLLCQSCGKVFARRALLNRHLLSHEKKESGTARPENSTDQNTAEESNGPEFPCPSCPKKFPTLLRLKRHENIHTAKNLKTFQCPKCKRSFRQELSLEKHLIAHAEKHRRGVSADALQRMFTCGHCYKDFSLRVQLNLHMKKKHSGDEKYTCAICSQVFTQKMGYLDHMVSVHGDGDLGVEVEDEQQEQPSDVAEAEGQDEGQENEVEENVNDTDTPLIENPENETRCEFTFETLDGQILAPWCHMGLISSALRKCEVQLTRVNIDESHQST